MRFFILLIIFFNTYLAQAQTLKVLTYNIHHGNPPAQKGVIDLEAIAKVIIEADADVVGIQEVDINVSRSGNINQAKRLAELTNMDFFFSKGINLEKGYYGTVILTKHKIIGKRRYDLPNPDPSEVRSLAIVDIELPDGKSFSVANTHLDLKPTNRIAQAEFINELGDLYSRPLILVGDLNAKPDAEAIKILENVFDRNTKNNSPTFPNTKPTEEIDYIMVTKNTKFTWLKYHVLPKANTESDHLPLYAEIKLK
ncbi:endonuclease/exonuclease/phosphatase family protein [Sphingobacterium rhinopitheci]|uniref:endonuclease/exonuclease/phosphatase family protein n=1 Tax=Sphingobacterium rhinopitheci TaxID=2781960 RepID=UPI001F5191C2|nr:endonuclease/exonuclease/phosphatase family protein [Sphingobacterium rhinopitheci]MCI0920469.1 endonuclease/exonuclease/phosphatase family protein [Sphingobacterium rhinopitheci]